MTVAPDLLATLPLRGALVTGDALYCQRSVCTQIAAAGGDYLVFVKGNQPHLLEAITLVFAEPPPGEVVATAGQQGRHGDRQEVRRLWTSTALSGYLDWPAAQQVAKVERTWTRHGRTATETRYLLTSLAVTHGPAVLLQRARGHWGIENRLHYVRDVTLGEDACRVRTAAAPQVLAALRNVVLGLLRVRGVTNIAAAIRDIGWRGTALALLGLAPP